MPIFNYKVRDKYGLLLKGKVTNNSKDNAVKALRSLNYSIINISEITPFEESIIKLSTKLQRVKTKDILAFTRQLSSMIHAGLPILTCFDNIIQQTAIIKFKEVLESVYTQIESGTSIAKAMEKHPKYFSKFYISMINVGEISGRLDEVLNRLVAIGKQESEIKSKMQSAMVYPIILLLLSSSVVFFLLIFVLPKFIVVYNSLAVELPTPTKILLAVSGFLQKFWWIVFSTLALLIFGFIKYQNTPQGKFNIDQTLLRLPIIGQLALKYNLARFARTIGSLLKSGIAVLQGIAVTEKIVSNNVIKTVLKSLRESILEGQTLSEQLKLSGIFPPMIIQMISAGEQTGKLDDMLLDVADFYDLEVDYEIKNMTTLIEPILLVCMGLIVLFMALAVLLPIFNLTKITH